MKKNNLFITLMVFLTFLCGVFAVTDDFFTEVGRDSFNSNEGNTLVDFSTAAVQTFSGIYPANTHVHRHDFPPLIGNVDGNATSKTEVVLPIGDFTVFQWDGQGSLIPIYPDLNIFGSQLSATRGSVPLLYDADEDGDYELYYCGIDPETGNTSVAAYDWNETAPFELWRTQVGAAGTGDSGHRCEVYNKVNPPPSIKNVTYAPTGAKVNGTHYVFFMLQHPSDDGGIEGWQFNALNGSTRTIDLTTEASVECPAGVKGVGMTQFLTADPLYGAPPGGKEYRNANVVSTTICPSGLLGELQWYAPVDCADGVGGGTRGLFAIRPDLMNTEFAFEGDGYGEVLGDWDHAMSSPACFESNAVPTPRMVTIGANPTTDTATIFHVEDGNVDSIDSEDLAFDFETMTDLFVGEFSDDTDIFEDDVCFFAYDYTLRRTLGYCTDIDNPLFFPDAVVAEDNPPGYSTEFSVHPYVVTTSNSWDSTTQLSHVFASFGTYVAAPNGDDGADKSLMTSSVLSDEGFNHVPNGFPEVEGACAIADINEDGFADAVCLTEENISISIAGNINTPIDFKQMIVDVGDTMCIGNQTFFVNYNNGEGYVDAEQDDIQFTVDCENNGTINVQSEFRSYTSNFQGSCSYATDGQHTASVSLRDSGSQVSETILYTTTVSNVSGCVEPDGIPSVIVVSVDDVTPTPPVTGLPDLGENLDDIAIGFGLLTQTSRDIFFLIAICLLMIGITQTSGPNGHIVAFGVGILGLAGLTVADLIRPVYLIVFMLSMVFIGTFLFFFRRQTM